MMFVLLKLMDFDNVNYKVNFVRNVIVGGTVSDC